MIPLLNYLSVIVSFCNHWPNKLRLVTLKCFLLEGDDDGNVINIINVSHESQPNHLLCGSTVAQPLELYGSAPRERAVTLRMFGVSGVHWAAPPGQHLQKARSALREDLVPTAACPCQRHTPPAWPIPAAAPAAPASPRAAPSPTPTARAAPATASATRSRAVPRQRYSHPRSPQRGKHGGEQSPTPC